MNHNRRQPRWQRKLKKLALMPVYALVNAGQAALDAADMLLQMVGLKGRVKKRRNKDFENAGRETPRVDNYDRAAVSNLNGADWVRDKEIIDRVKYEKRTLRKRNKEGDDLREALREEKLSVSQGESISHLAKMSEQARKKRNRDKSADQDESTDAKLVNEPNQNSSPR